MKMVLKGAACALALAAMAPATASAQAFFSGFENLPNGPTPGNFVHVSSADGWLAGTGPTDARRVIELQNNVAGSPAPTGGAVFVELDAASNSAMYRTIGTAGMYSLSFLYSPRPGQPSSTNGIQVFLNNTLLAPPGTVTGTGGANTSWSTISTDAFSVNAGDILSFRAVGTSDTFGGYVDNISFAAVPEPASWAMMIGGFGFIGGAMRRRRRPTLALA